MSMATSYLNATADAGGALITHIGLVDTGGTEIASGSYARQAVSWTAAAAGLIRPTANLVFNMTSGDEVGGWRGFTASSGGTNHGGGTLTTATFSNDGTYTLLAASTSIDHDAV